MIAVLSLNRPVEVVDWCSEVEDEVFRFGEFSTLCAAARLMFQSIK